MSTAKGKKAAKGKKTARVGAAAFALGLSLAGPQVGSAAADATEDGSAASASSGSDSAKASSPRAGRSQASVPRRGTESARSAEKRALSADVPARAGERAPRAAAAVNAPRAAAAAREDRGAGADGVPARAVSAPVVAGPAPSTAAPAAAPVASAPVTPAAVAAVPSTGGDTPVAGRAAAAAAAALDDSPTASAAAAPVSAPPQAVSARDRVVSAEKKFLNAVAHWLSELPASPLTNSLEGALLLVRKNFLNLAPGATLSPQTTSQIDGKIRGRINAVDFEGDGLTYSVVANPTSGTVEVLADGRYAYTPGSEFSGTDSFTVAIAPVKRSLNLLDPSADGSREVTVAIGGVQPKADISDIAVYLPSASGNIKVVKGGLFGKRFTGAVTLTGVSPDTLVSWMDHDGHKGQISYERLMTVKWPEFQARAAENGAGLDFTLAFTDADGVEKAVLLHDVAVSQDAAAQYVLTGRLAPDPELESGSADQWDVVGAEFKPLYESFRKVYNIEKGQTSKFTTVDFDFSKASVFFDTYTPTSYQQNGLYALDSEANPEAAEPPGGGAASDALAPLQAAAKVARTGVTASIPLGKSFVVGRNDGSVELWTDGQEQQLQNAGWSSPVKYLLDYSRPLKDAQGNTVASSFSGYISGTTLTVTGLGQGSSVVIGSEITGAGVKAGTKITAFVAESGSCSEESGSCTGGSGGSNGGPGTYTVSIAQTVGSAVAQVSPEDPSRLLPAGIEITQKGVNAAAPGFVVGLGNGSVQLWTASGGWTELHDSGWQAGVTSMITYGEGLVVGLDNGAVEKWNGPGADPDQSTWKNNWTELQNDGWDSGVTAMISYKGFSGTCAGGCDGLLVGLANGSVQQFNEARNGPGQPGWVELHDSGWNSAVKGIVLSGKGEAGLPTFAVGLQNGAVEQWQWNGSGYSWAEIQKPGKDGWNSEITAMTEFGDNFIVGLKNGAVFERVNLASGSGYWIELHNNGWNSQVNQIVPFESATLGRGVVVGLDNGSVQLWKGQTAGTNPDSGQAYWTELHDSGWASGIASIVPASTKVTDDKGDVVSQDGVVVGLENGALEQWSGLITGSTGQNDWTEIDGPQVNQAAKVLSQDGFLKSAVDFGLALADTGESPVWGADGSVGGAGDPLFSQPIFQKASTNTATGTYLPVVSYIPASLIKKTLEDPNGLTDSTVDLSFDVNALIYGYAYVPDGALAKLVPGKWSMAMLLGLQTGPSLTLNLSSAGTISTPDTNLFNYQYWTLGPLGFDSFAIDVGANAKLDVSLLGAEDKDSLKAYAYMVPGMLFTYNTESKPKGVQLGFSAYPDINASDFTSLTGIKVTPTLTPYVTASYGIMAPDTTPLIGGWSLIKISLGLENPVSASLCADTTAQCPTPTSDTGGNLSLTLDSEGYITASAGILDGVTDLLTWNGQFQVYDVNKTFLL